MPNELQYGKTLSTFIHNLKAFILEGKHVYKDKGCKTFVLQVGNIDNQSATSMFKISQLLSSSYQKQWACKDIEYSIYSSLMLTLPFLSNHPNLSLGVSSNAPLEKFNKVVHEIPNPTCPF